MKKVKLMKNDNLVTLEFPDKDAMNSALGRISHFRESKISAGVIADAKVPYSGHNFPMTTLIDFFKNLGSKKGPQQTDDEKLLMDLLKGEGCLKQDMYLVAYVKGDFKTRQHEALHARFFLDEEYRNEVTSLFQSLTEGQKEHIKNFLSRLGYAESVHIDEFQAYHFTEPANFWGIKLGDEKPRK